MASEEEGRGGGLETVAVAVIAVFVIAVLFGLISAITGLVWWIVKTAVLIGVLFLAVRWALRRSMR